MKRAAPSLLSLVLSGVFLSALAGAESPPNISVFGEKYRQLFQQPFFASARLIIRRPGIDRRLLLGLYYRDSGRAFARLSGSEREMGTVALRRDERIYLYFPRAELLLNLPPAMSSFPFFGSDFSVEDLLSFSDVSSRFIVQPGGEETVSGVPTLRYRLLPRAPASSLYAETRLWVARDGGAPLRQAFISEQGKVIREVVMEGDGKSPLPVRWRARTVGPRAGESELTFTFFERNPPVDDRLYTVEGLRLWR